MKPQDLQPGDYPAYYQTYVAHLPQKDLFDIFNMQRKKMNNFLARLKPNDLMHSYAPGKWTVGEVIQHMIDTERIFQYRALRIARNDKTPLAGYDQDAYVPVSAATQRTVDSFLKEYNSVREAGICLFENFNDEMFQRRGISNEQPLSTAAAAFIIAGHEKHHLLLFNSNYNL